MKKGTNFLAFAILALFVTLLACCEKEAEEPDITVVADNPDTIAYDYFVWYDTNMFNAIYGSGQSDFYFVNNPGIVDENKNYVDGDTTITISRKYLDYDSCQFYQLDTFPGNLSKSNSHIYASYSDIDSELRSEAWTVRFPTSRCRLNGSTVSNSPIQVVGNEVSILGHSFSVDDPSTYGPPSLASVLAQSINNPPSAPTSAQINALPCDEIVGSYFNDRLISVFIDKENSWTTNNDSYYWSSVYHLLFSHYWYYDCPDGPPERGMICIVEIKDKFWKNGILSSSTVIEAIYSHKY